MLRPKNGFCGSGSGSGGSTVCGSLDDGPLALDGWEVAGLLRKLGRLDDFLMLEVELTSEDWVVRLSL